MKKQLTIIALSIVIAIFSCTESGNKKVKETAVTNNTQANDSLLNEARAFFLNHYHRLQPVKTMQLLSQKLSLESCCIMIPAFQGRETTVVIPAIILQILE